VKLRVSLLLVVIAGLAACSTPRSEAIDQATAGARNAAAKALDYLRANLSSQAFADTLKSLPDNFQAGVVTVHDSTRDPSGAFSVRAVILGSGEAGGGGFAAELDVRLCVRYSGSLSGTSHVDMADTPCPDGLPTEDHGFPIEQNITLG